MSLILIRICTEIYVCVNRSAKYIYGMRDPHAIQVWNYGFVLFDKTLIESFLKVIYRFVKI